VEEWERAEERSSEVGHFYVCFRLSNNGPSLRKRCSRLFRAGNVAAEAHGNVVSYKTKFIETPQLSYLIHGLPFLSHISILFIILV